MSVEPAAHQAHPGPVPALWTPRFLTLWFVGLGIYGTNYLLQPVLPLFLEEAGWTAALIGLLLGSKNVTSVLIRPVAGWLTDRLGRKPVMLFGLVLLAVSVATLPFVTAVAGFALARVLNGIGWGSTTATGNTWAGDLAPPGRRGEAVGTYTMAGSIAMALGPAAGLFISVRFGFQAVFWLAAAVMLLGVLLGFLLQEPARAPAPPGGFSLRSLICLEALGPAAILALHSMTYSALIVFLPLRIQGGGYGDVGLFFLLYALLLAALRRPAGKVSDRFGRVAAIGPGLLFGSAAMLSLALAASAWAVYLGAVLFALAMALVQPPSLAWGLDLARGRQGTAMATMVAAQDLGIALGSSLMGLFGTIWGLNALFGVAAGVAAAAALGLALGRRFGWMPDGSTPGQSP